MAGDHLALHEIRNGSDDDTVGEFPPSSSASQYDTLKSRDRPYDGLDDTAYATVVDLGGAHAARDEAGKVDAPPTPPDPPKGVRLALLLLTLVRPLLARARASGRQRFMRRAYLSSTRRPRGCSASRLGPLWRSS